MGRALSNSRVGAVEHAHDARVGEDGDQRQRPVLVEHCTYMIQGSGFRAKAIWFRVHKQGSGFRCSNKKPAENSPPMIQNTAATKTRVRPGSAPAARSGRTSHLVWGVG